MTLKGLPYPLLGASLPERTLTATPTLLPSRKETELGSVAWTVAKEGQVDKPPLGNWEIEESAMGGYLSASGILGSDRVKRYRELYTDGALVEARHAESGEVLFAGEGRDTAPPLGGEIDYAADGWARLAEAETGRLLFQKRGYDGWSQYNAEPHQAGTTSPISADPKENCLRFRMEAGAVSGTVALALWLPGTRYQLSGIKFSYATQSWGTGSFSAKDLKVRRGLGPDGALTTVLTEALAGSGTVNQAITDDMIVLELTLTISSGSPGFELLITDLVIGGIAGTGDFYASDAAVRYVLQKIGVGVGLVQGTGLNIVPHDHQGGSAAEFVDWMMAMTDGQWGIRGTAERPVGQGGPWGERTWTPVKASPPDLIPIQRYDRVVLGYPGAGGQEVEVVVDSNVPLSHRRRRSFPSVVPLPRGQANDTAATEVGRRIVNYLRGRRFAGGRIIQTARDENGAERSGYLVRPGGLVYEPDVGVALRVASCRRTKEGNAVSYDARYAALDSLAARKRLAEQHVEFEPAELIGPAVEETAEPPLDV